MLTVNYILSQILVIIAIGLYALTFLLKTKKNVLIIGLLGVVLNTISFILLGAYTGAVVNVVAMVRSLWFFFEEKKDRRTWISLTVVMTPLKLKKIQFSKIMQWNTGYLMLALTDFFFTKILSWCKINSLGINWAIAKLFKELFQR